MLKNDLPVFISIAVSTILTLPSHAQGPQKQTNAQIDAQLKAQAKMQAYWYDTYSDRFREFHISSAKNGPAISAFHQAQHPDEAAENATRFYESSDGKLPPAQRALLRKALEMKFRQKFDESIDALEKLLAVRPKYKPGIFELADTLSLAKRFKEAIAALNDVIKYQPTNWYATELRGYCYFSLRRFDEGIADCNLTIKLNPKWPRPYENRATAYRMMGKFKEAEADRRTADDLRMPEVTKDLVAAGRFTDALKIIDRYVASHPKEPMGYDHRGYLLIAMSKYKDAIEDFTKLITLDPNIKPHATAMRAKAYDCLGQYQKAADDLTVSITACEALPKPVPGKNYPLKIAQMLPMREFYTQYLKERARDYIQLQRFADALKDCNTVIATDKQLQSAEDYALRADVYAAWGKDQQALDDYMEAGKLDAKMEYAFVQSGRLADSLHQPDIGIAAYSRLIAIHSDLAELRIARAKHYLAAKKYALAEADLNEAQKKDMNDPVVYDTRGAVRMTIGNYAAAVIDFSKALKCGSGNSAALLEERAQAYEKLGRSDLAGADRAQAARVKAALSTSTGRNKF